MNTSLPPNAVTLDLELLQQLLGGKELDLLILRSQLKKAQAQIAELQANDKTPPAR